MPSESFKVLLGMTGGVDSSTSAWILKRDGYQVVGVTLLFHDCATTEAKVEQAKRVAEQLEIEHHIVDMRERFSAEVVDSFVVAANAGVVGNPCLQCTTSLKLPLLFEQAEEYGCDAVATGHYARVTSEGYGVGLLDYQLRSPLDRSKDQTYLLYRLTQEQLARLMFPLADINKPVVRKMAMQVGLQRLSPLHDGQGEPCFFEGSSAVDWLGRCDGLDATSGDIVDITSHVVVGHHEGLYRYMPGDRVDEGYVIAKDAEQGELYVGPFNLSSTELAVLEDMHWTSIEPPTRRRSCRVRIGYDATPVPAHILCTDAGVAVTFTRPVRGVYPGLPVVLYSDDLVLGGGIVAR